MLYLASPVKKPHSAWQVSSLSRDSTARTRGFPGHIQGGRGGPAGSRAWSKRGLCAPLMPRLRGVEGPAEGPAGAASWRDPWGISKTFMWHNVPNGKMHSSQNGGVAAGGGAQPSHHPSQSPSRAGPPSPGSGLGRAGSLNYRTWLPPGSLGLLASRGQQDSRGADTLRQQVCSVGGGCCPPARPWGDVCRTQVSVCVPAGPPPAR